MKRALVLSGGGLFGAYQAGAWKAIAERFDPDIVVGASAGSMNAFAIACGVTPDELIDRWLTLELPNIRHFPATLNRDFDRYQLKKEFGVALCRLPILKHELVTNGAVSARHILASCSVPGIFPPVRIDGSWYVDGGLVDALPVWAAIQMGAEDIIGVHVWTPMPWYFHTANRAFRMMTGHKRYVDGPLPSGIRLRIIAPRKRLGPYTTAYTYRQDKIKTWIAEGESDAMAVLEP